METREAVIGCFTAHTFDAGQPLMLTGEDGHHLGIILRGAVEIEVRRDDQALAVARLEAGDIVGEMSFFDPQLARTADVIGVEPGIVAMLPYTVYQQLVRDTAPAAEVLEKNVLDILSLRMKATNQRLAELLEANKRGGLLSALARLFGAG